MKKQPIRQKEDFIFRILMKSSPMHGYPMTKKMEKKAYIWFLIRFIWDLRDKFDFYKLKVFLKSSSLFHIIIGVITEDDFLDILVIFVIVGAFSQHFIFPFEVSLVLVWVLQFFDFVVGPFCFFLDVLKIGNLFWELGLSGCLILLFDLLFFPVHEGDYEAEEDDQ